MASEGCWTLNLADLAKKAIHRMAVQYSPLSNLIVNVYHGLYICLLYVYIPLGQWHPTGFLMFSASANMLAMPAMRSALASTLPAQDPGAGDRTQPLLSLYWAWKAWNFGDLNVVGGQHFLTLGGHDVWKCLEMSGNVSIFQLWSRKIRSGC